MGVVCGTPNDSEDDLENKQPIVSVHEKQKISSSASARVAEEQAQVLPPPQNSWPQEGFEAKVSQRNRIPESNAKVKLSVDALVILFSDQDTDLDMLQVVPLTSVSVIKKLESEEKPGTMATMLENGETTLLVFEFPQKADRDLFVRLVVNHLLGLGHVSFSRPSLLQVERQRLEEEERVKREEERRLALEEEQRKLAAEEEVKRRKALSADVQRARVVTVSYADTPGNRSSKSLTTRAVSAPGLEKSAFISTSVRSLQAGESEEKTGDEITGNIVSFDTADDPQLLQPVEEELDKSEQALIKILDSMTDVGVKVHLAASETIYSNLKLRLRFNEQHVSLLFQLKRSKTILHISLPNVVAVSKGVPPTANLNVSKGFSIILAEGAKLVKTFPESLGPIIFCEVVFARQLEETVAALQYLLTLKEFNVLDQVTVADEG